MVASVTNNNPGSKWNITNSAQNIVSALVDPSNKFDEVFRKEWANTFSHFSKQRTSNLKPKKNDPELIEKLNKYVKQIESHKRLVDLEEKIASQDEEREKQFVSNVAKIPKIFRQENFDLSNPSTFNQVLLLQGGGDNINVSDVNCLKDIQTELSEYLDFIEEMLEIQIRNRSGDFFQVMSSVDSMMYELSLSIKSVTNIRNQCAKINQVIIEPYVKHAKLKLSKKNMETYYEKLLATSELLQNERRIQHLMSNNNYLGALDAITESKKLIDAEYKSVIMLENFKSELDDTEKGIVVIMGKYQDLKYSMFVDTEKKINSELQKWTAKPPVPSSQFKELMEHCNRVYIEMQDILPQSELLALFVKIDEAFKDALRQRLKNLGVKDEMGPQKWTAMQDLTFYKSKMQQFTVFKDREFDYTDIFMN